MWKWLHIYIHIYIYTYLQIFRVAYCLPFSVDKLAEYKAICQGFVDAVKEYQPDFLRKVKIHMLLHLVDNMLDFGPCSAFNTERWAIEILSLQVWVWYHSTLVLMQVWVIQLSHAGTQHLCKSCSSEQRHCTQLCCHWDSAFHLWWWDHWC